MFIFKKLNTFIYSNSILFFLIFLINGCKTPIYQNVDFIEDKNNINPIVQFSTNKNFNPNSINCITVGNIIDASNNNDFKNIEKSKLLRNSILGMLNSKNYEIVRLPRADYFIKQKPDIKIHELLNKLNCDTILTGKILQFQNNYFVSYSVTTVEIYLELTDKFNNILWSAKHAASSHEGALPLSPISLLTGLIVATSNKQDEVAYQMIDAVSRRIISTLPDKNVIEFLSFEEPSILDILITEKINKINNPQNLLTKGAYEEALTLSKKLIKKNPNILENFLYASIAELKLKNYSSSINYALKAIASGYEKEEIFSILGIAYLKSKQINMAEASFQKGLMIKPSSSLLNYNLALLKEIQSDWKTSAKIYFLAGTLSLDEKSNIRLYKSLKSLKRLSTKNVYAKEYYNKLGVKVSNFLKVN